MTYSPILAPVVALVAWTMVMFVWMYATRLPAMRRAGISLKNRVGTRGEHLKGVVPDEVNWKAHNYNHLMEQPTLFYALCGALALMDAVRPAVLWLAWAYVVLRVLHSLVQATVNIVRYRLLLFTLSSVCLFGLALAALGRITG